MKKLKVLSISAVAIWAAGYTLVSNFSGVPNVEPNKKALAVLEQAGCVMCHSKEAKLPFYAHIPLAGQLIKTDKNIFTLTDSNEVNAM